MYIELDDREIKLLKQYAKVYEGERNIDRTADPIVLVQEKEKRMTDGEYGYGDYEYDVYINHCSLCDDYLYPDIDEVEKNIREYLADYDLTDDEDIDNTDVFYYELDELIDDMKFDLEGFVSADYWEGKIFGFKIEVKKHYFEYYYKTVAYFFTRAEAKKYVKYQAHNLHEPRVFTDYAGYNNKGDFPVFQKMLLGMGEQLNDGTEEEIEKEWGIRSTNIIIEQLKKCNTKDECMDILEHYNLLFGWCLARRGSRRVPMKNIALQVEEDLRSYVRERFGV